MRSRVSLQILKPEKHRFVSPTVVKGKQTGREKVTHSLALFTMLFSIFWT
jgi:hypothetical protein